MEQGSVTDIHRNLVEVSEDYLVSFNYHSYI
jgi:hypothetical protein